MRQRSGRKSSPLDDIRPTSRRFDEERLDLLWMLEASVDLLPVAAAFLDEILQGEILRADELPAPDESERAGPTTVLPFEHLERHVGRESD